MSLAPLAAAPLVIQIHVAAALLALIGGVVVASMRKGTARHRQVGYIFAVGMLFTAVSSLWITSSGRFSWIHLLTLLTLVSLPYAIIMRRRGNIDAHRTAMTGMFIGLIIAGVFTLLPGRAMHAAVFGGP